MKTQIKVCFAWVVTLILCSFSYFSLGYKAGDKAEDLKLKNVDGKQLSLSSFKQAKGFIVVFTCNHCPYAQACEQRIINLDKKYASKGYPVIAINPNDPVNYPDDSFENMVKRSKEKNYPFPYLIDETQEVARKYGALKTPHVFLLQRNGNDFEVKYVGAIDDNTEDEAQVKSKYVEQAIDALESGRSIAVTETKAIGCSIKFRK